MGIQRVSGGIMTNFNGDPKWNLEKKKKQLNNNNNENEEKMALNLYYLDIGF